MNIHSINPLKNNNASCSILKTKSCNNNIAKNLQAEPFNQNTLRVNLYNLNSKFNIHFGKNPLEKEDFNLDEFCASFEKRILQSIESKNIKLNSSLKTSKDTEAISRTFQEDNITSIYKTGVSLNSALHYLSLKEQIELCNSKHAKAAFMVDEGSNAYIRKIKNEAQEQEDSEYEKFINFVNSGDIALYCTDNDTEEIETFEQLTGIEKEKIKLINTKQADFSDKYPDKDKIKRIIQIFSQYKFPDDKQMQEKFARLLSNYLNDSYMFLSYQELALKLKEQYGLIESEIKKQGGSMDDVIYLLPLKFKSYDLINYLYAKENNISPDKFIYLKDIKKTDDKKTYVVLDDVSMSGGSFVEDVIKRFYEQSLTKQIKGDLILAPIVHTKNAKYRINHSAKRYPDLNIKFISKTQYNPIGFNNAAKYCEKNTDEFIQKYLKNFETLDKEQIETLMQSLCGGCGEQYSCIFFPYMIPDNSSDFATVFAGYFLNNDNPEANKGIDPELGSCFAESISEKNYNNLKIQIG